MVARYSGPRDASFSHEVTTGWPCGSVRSPSNGYVDGVPDDDTQTEIPTGPDLRHPDWVFRDGAGLACVRAMPVWTPTWGTRSVRFDLDSAIFLIALSWARRGIWLGLRRDGDERWKLVVSRKRRDLGWWRTVAIEFFEDEEGVDVRRAEILSGWSANAHSTLPLIGPSERRRLRLAGQGE